MSKSIEDMSDEEIMSMANAPAASDIVPVPEEQPVVEEPVVLEEPVTEVTDPEDEGTGTTEEDENADPDANADGTTDVPEDDVSGTTNPLDESDDDFVKPKPAEKPKAPEAKAEDDKAKPAKPDDKPKPDAEAVAPVDYKAGYELIMAPFRANGKDVQVQSPQEAIQLMQLGANYTKKLQSLQPTLKMVKSLENNGLLNSEKINYLIDLSKKDPEAIKKLIADSGIDPMDIDTSEKSTYQPKNHAVSDKQMHFDNALTEASSDPKGQELLVHINKEWDKESKKVIFDDPTILEVLTKHKQAGFYDQIMSEVERQETLGNLKGKRRIDAYYEVGGIMNKNGLLKPPAAAPQAQPTTEEPAPAKRVVATRPAPQKAVSGNGDKAKAALPTRNAPAPAPKRDYNPLSMSDEDFEKTANLAQRL
jgi:hypothetical protein